MAGDTTGDEKLFVGGEVGNGAGGGAGTGPGPGGEFVDEVVSREEEFFGGDLAGGAKGGGMAQGSETVAEGGDGGADDIHGWFWW